MTLHWIAVAALAVCTVPLLRAEFADDRIAIYRMKPLCSLLMVTVGFLALTVPGHAVTFAWGIVVGLILSFGGDMALMFKPKPAFVAGLALFLFAHVAYAIIFTRGAAIGRGDLLTALVVGVLSAAVYAYLFPGLGSMKVSVLLYVAALAFMLQRALATFGAGSFTPQQCWLMAVGASLFYLSDLILAINKFRRPFRHNRISLVFYYAGQVCIGLTASVPGA